MSLIEKWYTLRNSRLEGCSDQSEERTETINGVNRTTTLFPDSAFLSYEQQKEIGEQTRYVEKDRTRS